MHRGAQRPCSPRMLAPAIQPEGRAVAALAANLRPKSDPSTRRRSAEPRSRRRGFPPPRRSRTAFTPRTVIVARFRQPLEPNPFSAKPRPWQALKRGCLLSLTIVSRTHVATGKDVNSVGTGIASRLRATSFPRALAPNQPTRRRAEIPLPTLTLAATWALPSWSGAVRERPLDREECYPPAGSLRSGGLIWRGSDTFGNGFCQAIFTKRRRNVKG